MASTGPHEASEGRTDVGAVILAAGRSRRMGGSDKLWSPLRDEGGRSRPLLYYPLATFQACPAVSRVILVAATDAIDKAGALVRDEGFSKVSSVVPGGDRRRDSVLAGLEALESCEWVIVHDAARPLVTADLIERGLEEARETGASTTALPAPDTVKESDDGRFVAQTLDRSRLWLSQTPQTFRYALLLQGHRQNEADVTDDAVLVEAVGVKVRLYPGSPRSMKVTTPQDLVLVQALLAGSS